MPGPCLFQVAYFAIEAWLNPESFFFALDLGSVAKAREEKLGQTTAHRDRQAAADPSHVVQRRVRIPKLIPGYTRMGRMFGIKDKTTKDGVFVI